VGCNVEQNTDKSFSLLNDFTFVLVNEKLRHQLEDLVLLLRMCCHQFLQRVFKRAFGQQTPKGYYFFNQAELVLVHQDAKNLISRFSLAYLLGQERKAAL
jgi:hypothetical protein